jgi:hypothetical protein
VKKVKRVMLMSLALALLLLTMVMPALAEAAEKVPVTVKSQGGGSTIPGEIWLTDGDITQFRGWGSKGGILEIYITSTTTPDYTVVTNSEYDSMLNWKTGEGIIHYRSIWEYKVDGQIAGSLKGEYTVKTTGAYFTPEGAPVTWTHLEGHCVLQGDGVFEGWTLKLESEATRPARPTYTGWLITR